MERDREMLKPPNDIVKMPHGGAHLDPSHIFHQSLQHGGRLRSCKELPRAIMDTHAKSKMSDWISRHIELQMERNGIPVAFSRKYVWVRCDSLHLIPKLDDLLEVLEVMAS